MVIDDRSLDSHQTGLLLTDLARLIPALSYPSLERRLSALRAAGQVEGCLKRRREMPYVASDWLRQAVAPIAAAARWEQSQIPAMSVPLSDDDAQVLLLLAAPLIDVDPRLWGSCCLSVDSSKKGAGSEIGVLLAVVDGTVTACTPRLHGEATAAVTASAAGWLEALVAGDTAQLEFGGDPRVAKEVVGGLHTALFGAAQEPRARSIGTRLP
jgi:hypothetical protein